MKFPFNRKKTQTPAAEPTAAGVPVGEDGPPAGAAEAVTASLARRIITRVVVIAAFLLIFFVGLCVLFYPSLSNYINEKNQSRVIDIYEESLVPLSAVDYETLRQAARAYNAALASGGAAVTDAFSAGAEDEDRSDPYWDLLDVSGTGVMGYVSIPKINVRLPLYHGVAEEVLAKGVGHIQGSSLPVGGAGTHSVISAHTGLPSAKLFTDVDQLVTGDLFQLIVLDEVLTYQVDQILTVLPYEVEALAIVPGGDYVTMVTCTPYGVNSHRLLIRGTRIETPPQEEVQAALPGAQEGAVQAEKPKSKLFLAFADLFEAAATGVVKAAEWGMDLFGVEY